MGDIFTRLDLVLFFAALVGVMAVGLIAGRKEETAEDYFLAGRKIPWWGVAGSIFGSNVSANHMVGMLGVGFSIGFFQSHFELGAIFGLLALCYGFLPVYRKLKVYTLSGYLARRYDNRSRLAYAAIMVTLMAFVQMVPALYIGARTICVLLGNEAAQQEVVTEKLVGDLDTFRDDRQEAGANEAADKTPPGISTGKKTIKPKVNHTYYAGFVIALAIISAAYTIFGGLKAVVWTDVMQSVLLLIAGILVAVLTFQQLGGWGAMMAADQVSAHEGGQKMHLYLPSSHVDLPWTGVLTGLMALHLFYWGTNQFIVQRALGARSDSEARMGIVAAGFLKLLIPFFAIATGVAASYLFRREMPEQTIAPDTAFPELVKLVIPVGFGLIGIIAAGLIGAILSSIDSMMNSAATIITVDIYKQFINPQADDRQMIFVGRVTIVVLVIVAALMAIFVLDPNSEANFFLKIADYSGYLIPGVLVAFILGMFWRRATAAGAIVTIVAGVVFSGALNFAYDAGYGMNPAVYSVATGEKNLRSIKVDDLPEDVREMKLWEMNKYIIDQAKRITPVNTFLGPKLNFFHRVVGVIMLCLLTHIIVSLLSKPDEEKGRLVWTDLGGHTADDLKIVRITILVSIGFYAFMGWVMYQNRLHPTYCGLIAALWTLAMFVRPIRRSMDRRRADENSVTTHSGAAAVIREDRFWAAILCALAVFMHYYFR